MPGTKYVMPRLTAITGRIAPSQEVHRYIKDFYGSQVAKLPNYLYRKSDNIHKAVRKRIAVLQDQHSGIVSKTQKKYTNGL